MTLNFSFTEADDNSSITIKDTTSDWIVGQIAEIYAHRADGNTKATLDITVFGIAYETIDVMQWFSTGIQADMEFVITPDMLTLLGVPQFNVGDDFPDGDVEIVYTVADNHNGQSDTFTDTYFVYGAIEELVLEEMLDTNVQALTCGSSLHKASVRLLWFSYLMGMINSSYTGQIANLRTSLTNLNFMVANNTY